MYDRDPAVVYLAVPEYNASTAHAHCKCLGLTATFVFQGARGFCLLYHTLILNFVY